MNDEMSRLRRSVGDHEDELEQQKSNEGQNQKYEVLFKRDQEMTKFIEDFAETEAKGLAQQKETQQMIVSLLEAMSKDLARQNNMPSRDQVSEMQNDLSFKERQLKASQSTQERLEAELEKARRAAERLTNWIRRLQ